MADKRLITIQVEQTDLPVLDHVLFSDAVKAGLANIGGTIVVTAITVAEHAVAVVEQETFLGQFKIEV